MLLATLACQRQPFKYIPICRAKYWQLCARDSKYATKQSVTNEVSHPRIAMSNSRRYLWRTNATTNQRRRKKDGRENRRTYHTPASFSPCTYYKIRSMRPSPWALHLFQIRGWVFTPNTYTIRCTCPGNTLCIVVESYRQEGCEFQHTMVHVRVNCHYNDFCSTSLGPGEVLCTNRVYVLVERQHRKGTSRLFRSFSQRS